MSQIEYKTSVGKSIQTNSTPRKRLSSMSKCDLVTAIRQLQDALRYDLITLEYIKVDQLPQIDGKEITEVYGVPLRTHIYEHEADVWIAGVEEHPTTQANKEEL
jgi:hypothetical protein